MKGRTYFILLVIFCVFGFMSCKTDFSEDHKRYKWERNSFEDENDFLSMRKDLTIKDGTVYTTVKSGTGTWARLNWSCANLGMPEHSTGIEIDLWLNENLKTVGFQWWQLRSEGDSFYWVYFAKDGNFVIHKAVYNSETRSRKESVKRFRTAESGINPKKTNRIKMGCDSDGNMNFYVNGKLMYTIEKDDLLFEEGRFFIVYQEIPDQQYSDDCVGKAKHTLRKQQIVK